MRLLSQVRFDDDVQSRTVESHRLSLANFCDKTNTGKIEPCQEQCYLITGQIEGLFMHIKNKERRLRCNNVLL